MLRTFLKLAKFKPWKFLPAFPRVLPVQGNQRLQQVLSPPVEMSTNVSHQESFKTARGATQVQLLVMNSPVPLELLEAPGRLVSPGKLNQGELLGAKLLNDATCSTPTL